MPLVNLHRFSYFPTGHALSNSFRTQRWEYWCTKVLLQGCRRRGEGGMAPSDFGRSGDGGRLYPPDYYLPLPPDFQIFLRPCSPSTWFKWWAHLYERIVERPIQFFLKLTKSYDEAQCTSRKEVWVARVACCSLEFSAASLKNKIMNLLIEKLKFHRMYLCFTFKWYFVTKTVRKNCSNDREKPLKFETEHREFTKDLRSLEQFIQTVKVQINFG